jgi:polysaccharide export outer membrane protein
MAALAVAGCMRQQQPAYYVIDPQTGQPVPVVSQQQFTQPQYGQPQYQQAQYPQAQYQQAYAPPAYQPQTARQPSASGGRGLMSGRQAAAVPPGYVQQAYVQQPYAQQQPAPQQPYVIQYSAPQYAAAQYGAPQYAAQPYGGQQYAAPYGYASAPATTQQPYTLDSGDKLRIVVFGQDGISNSYTVDAGGNISLPLVGTVPARGTTTQQLTLALTERLKQGYVREPHVSVEVEAYRPFFILGEVTNPGQYPYVANMTAETAVAIAGGFAPRASKSKVELTRNAPGQQMHGDVPLGYPLRPGDTIVVKERWF